MAALRCILTIAAASALPQGWEATLTKELQKIADHETAKWNTSFSIAFQNGAGSASAAAGDIGGGKSSTVDDDYVWGSVTKVVTGASILKLASEGRFDLRSPMAPLVDRFLAKLAKQPDWRHDWSSLGELWGDQNVSTATIEELLHMQSRVPDFDTATPCGRSAGPGCAPTDDLRKTLYRTKQGFTPPELLDVPWVAHRWAAKCASRHEGMAPFCYSSTNFMLLGMILADALNASSIEALDQGHFLPDELRTRLRFANDGRPPSAYSPVHGIDRTSYNVPKGAKNDNDDSSVPGVFSGWTASDVVGPPSAIADLAFQVYAAHAVAPAAYVAKMVPSDGGDGTPYEIYGLATHNLGSRTGQDKSAWGVAYGHLGATYDYQSIVAYFPKLGATIAVATALETDDQQQPADALCLSYNKAIDVLLDLDHNCTYVVGDYYSGGCKCDPVPETRA